MELDAFAHDERAGDVVLHAPPQHQEADEQPRVGEPGEETDRDDDDARRHRSNDRNELERPADGRQEQRVRHAGHVEQHRPDHERDHAEHDQRAHVVAEDLIDVADDLAPQPTSGAAVDHAFDGDGETLAVLEDEECEDRHEHDHPRAGQPLQTGRHDRLGLAGEILSVRAHGPFDAGDRGRFPAVASQELADDLAALDPLRHLGQPLRQRRRLVGEHGHERGASPEQDAEHREVHEADGDRAMADVEDSLNDAHERKHEVGEKDRKRQEHQEVAKDVDQPESGGDHQRGPDDAQRAGVETEHPLRPVRAGRSSRRLEPGRGAAREGSPRQRAREWRPARRQ